MGFTRRRIVAECKLCEALSGEALSGEALGQGISPALVEQAAQAARARRTTASRTRRLNEEVTLWLVLAWHLFPRHAIPAVWRELVHGLRLLWPEGRPERGTEAQVGLPTASAWVYRRYHLGARPLVTLFQAVGHPLATPATAGAFRFGLRLVGLDGTIENVPDTPAHAHAFGRRRSQRGPSVYPQVLGVDLVEIGTHAIFEAGFWPGPSSEHPAARRLVRALEHGMLVLWDRGFHSLGLLHAVRRQGAHGLGRLPAHGLGRLPAHGLGRLPAHGHPHILRPLSAGSALAYLRPARPHKHPQADPQAEQEPLNTPGLVGSG